MPSGTAPGVVVTPAAGRDLEHQIDGIALELVGELAAWSWSLALVVSHADILSSEVSSCRGEVHHGRIVTADTPNDLRDQLVHDWWDTARDEMAGSIMIGLRRADVDDLNHRARARMHTDRRLTGPTLQAAGIELQVGDRIVGLRNSRRHGIVNGTRATITRIDPDRRAIDATTDDGRTVVLTRDYLDAGHVTHGYAITGHKAQGLTVDHTYVLGSEALYREWGYVAMSRGRHTNRLYQTVLDQHLDEIHHHAHQPDDLAASLAARMARSRMQEPVTPELEELADRWRHLHARLHAPDIARQRALTTERASLVRTRQSDLAQLDRLARRIDHAASGLGRIRNRRMIDELTAEHADRTTTLHRLDHRLRQVDAELAAGPTAADIAELQTGWRELSSQIDAAARQRVAGYRQAPPDYLVTALGPPPADHGAARWHETATTVEDYRLRWNVNDPDQPLGGAPTDPLQQADHRHAAATIEHHRREQQLEREAVRGRSRNLRISLSR
jgi:hypothetical protein